MPYFTVRNNHQSGLTALAIAGIACLAAIAVTQQARADVNSFTLRQPMNNATVREIVPLRVPRNLLNQAGYASISIDGQFRGAPAVPQSGDVVYEWDTKHAAAPDTSGSAGSSSSSTADQPESPDGRHVIQVSLFDKDSNEIATATSTVRVLNHITTLPDGVRLVYKWRPDEIVTYRLHSVLKNQSIDSDTTTSQTSSATPPAIQDVYARLQRSVENVGSDGVLLRDHYASGTFGATPLTQAFTLASKYITVNKNGDYLGETPLPGNGLHYGYGVDSFPDRRVGAGDSWQTQMMISLPWAVEKMTTVRGQARLDDFEWESGYPTAKIVETYTGPATFKFDERGQSSGMAGEGMRPPQFGSMGSGGGGLSASQASSNSVQASNITVSRTIWFAYESGIVVREDTSLTTSATPFGTFLSSLTAPSSTGGAQSGYGRPGMMGAPGSPYAPQPGGSPYGPSSSLPPPGTPADEPGTEPYGSPYSQGGEASVTSTNLESDKTLTLLGVS